ncbi:MAG: alpha/beta fold hydrolase, partial [Streptosporangiaceae bacterium]
MVTGTRLRVGALVAALALAGSIAVSVGAAATARSVTTRSATLRVGHEILHRCGGAWCGQLRVPLDYAIPDGPTISILFSWYPAEDQSAPVLGTVVPVEGGPGYPSIGSVAPDGYAAMYGPLLAHRNMLAVDLRGTGGSTVIGCPSLQNFDGSASGSTATSGFERVVAACAASLNRRWRSPHGAFIHASDLFTSAVAARDLAGVLAALELGQVDLYGDSYGSWFAQVFASRYPSRVRSLTLDSTYAVDGLDPWYVSTIQAMPRDFDEACTRSPACAAAEHMPAWQRISELAARLRSSPVTGTVPGPYGTDVHEQMGVVGLVDLVNDATEDTSIYAELDAAASALLVQGDAAPLLRLYAQRLNYDEDYFGIPAQDYSAGLYLAVSCLDYPQLFNMDSSPAQRRAELAASERSYSRNAFAPFTIGEWLAQDQNTEAYTACLDWPSPKIAEPPVAAQGPRLPSHLPVLILGGEFDTWTPPSGIAQVQREIGGHSRVVIMANSTHVVAEGESTGCAVSVLRAFVSEPARLDQINAGCAAQVPAIQSVGVFPSTVAQTPPLHPTGHGTHRRAVLDASAAMVDTAGDAVIRYNAI